MNSDWSNRLAALATAALLSLPVTALAQPSQGQSAAARNAAPPPPVAAASPMAAHPAAGKNAQERVEQRIKELHTQLQITPAQQAQWDQFARVMRENARDMDQAFMQRAQQFPKMNAVQNMRSYEQIAEEHTQRLLYSAMPDRAGLHFYETPRPRAASVGVQRRRNG